MWAPSLHDHRNFSIYYKASSTPSSTPCSTPTQHSRSSSITLICPLAVEAEEANGKTKADADANSYDEVEVDAKAEREAEADKNAEILTSQSSSDASAASNVSAASTQPQQPQQRASRFRERLSLDGPAVYRAHAQLEAREQVQAQLQKRLHSCEGLEKQDQRNHEIKGQHVEMVSLKRRKSFRSRSRARNQEKGSESGMRGRMVRAWKVVRRVVSRRGVF